MKILVTGGAGYVGHFVTKKLLDLGHTVTVLDNLTYGDSGLQEFIGRDRFSFSLGDIGSLKSVVKAVKGQDAVIALAAIVGDPACNLNPEETLNTNFLATKLMIDVCEHYGVRRIVFASSCSVYGDTKNSIADELYPLNPLSLYAETRVMSEQVLLDPHRRIAPVILRLSTVFGYSARMRFDLVVNFLTAKAHYHQKFTVFGGDQWRPLIHTQDVADAFILAALASEEKVNRQIFNVGASENTLKVDEIASLVNQVFPKTKIERKKELEDKRNYRVSFDKIFEVLEFKSQFAVSDGIREIKSALEQNKIKNFEEDIYYNAKYLYKGVPVNQIDKQ